MIVTPLVPIRRWMSAHCNWLSLSPAVTTAVNGFLTLGLLAQSMLIAAAVLKRLIDK